MFEQDGTASLALAVRAFARLAVHGPFEDNGGKAATQLSRAASHVLWVHRKVGSQESQGNSAFAPLLPLLETECGSTQAADLALAQLRDLSQPEGSEQAAEQKLALMGELAASGSPVEQALQALEAAQLLRQSTQPDRQARALQQSRAAVELLEAQDPRPVEELAAACAMLGICQHEAGEAYDAALERALQLYLQLTGDAPSDATRRRQAMRHLHALAGLFGLLKDSVHQVLVYKLIVALNRQVFGDEQPHAATVGLLARCGYTVSQMGYADNAASLFMRAEAELDALASPARKRAHSTYSLYQAGHLLEQQEFASSQRLVDDILQTTDTAELHAKAMLLSSEAHLHDGNPASALKLAKDALRLNTKQQQQQQQQATLLDWTGDDAAEADSPWELLAELLNSLYMTGQLYLVQGFPREARFYLKKGLQFAQESRTVSIELKFLILMAEVALKLQQHDEAGDLLQQAAALQESVSHTHEAQLDTARLAQLRGDAARQRKAWDEAQAHYEAAAATLRRLMDEAYVTQVAAASSPSRAGAAPAPAKSKSGKSAGGRAGKRSAPSLRETCLRGQQAADHQAFPRLGRHLAAVLSAQAWTAFQRDPSTLPVALMDEASRCPVTGISHAVLHFNLGMIHYHHERRQQTADKSPPPAAQPETPAREDAGLSAKELGAKTVAELKAMLKAQSASTTGRKADLVARLLELAGGTSPAAATAATEEVPAAAGRAPETSASRAESHLLAAFEGSTRLGDPTLLREVCLALGLLLLDTEPDRAFFFLHAGLGITSRQERAVMVQEQATRAELSLGQPHGFVADLHTQLPADWTVVSVSFAETEQQLVVTRLVPGQPATLVAIPAHSVEETLAEMQAIIDGNTQTVKSHVPADDENAKASWWTGRYELEKRLHQLLRTVQSRWLGPWQGLLLGQHEDAAAATAFQQHVAEVMASLTKTHPDVAGHPGRVAALLAGLESSLLSDAQLEAGLLALCGRDAARLLELKPLFTRRFQPRASQAP